MGVPEAMNYIGLMYEMGDAIEQDFERSYRWYLRALRANHTNKFASYKLGLFHYQGVAVPKDLKIATDYFLNAAKFGSSEAMNELGLMCEAGMGVPQNYTKAMEWYLRAIRTNNKNRLALYNAARMYYNGWGVEKNIDRAYTYLNASIALGINIGDANFAKSSYLMGCLLLEYHKDYEEATTFFMMAGKMGNIPEAWHNLGWMASQGILPKKLYGGTDRFNLDSTAHYYYTEAAKLGYVSSMDEVGRLNIIYGDMETAVYWLKKAAEKGYEPSIKRLEKLNKASKLMKFANSLPGGRSSNLSSIVDGFTQSSKSSFEESHKSGALFKDKRGNLCAPGAPFYDGRDNLCEWGGPFYDFNGNYCTPGSAFYDSKGNYCTWGSPFYDAEGHYIVP